MELWDMLAAYFLQDIYIVDKSLDIWSVETVADCQPKLHQNGMHISHRLEQWASAKAGWHNRSCLTVDMVLQQTAGCSVGSLRLDDAVAVDS